MKKIIAGGILGLTLALAAPAAAAPAANPTCMDYVPGVEQTVPPCTVPTVALDPAWSDFFAGYFGWEEYRIKMTNEGWIAAAAEARKYKAQADALREKVRHQRHRIHRLERRIHRLRAQLESQ